MKRKKLEPRDLARCALTSLRLANIQQSFFADVLPDLEWCPVDFKSTAKAASKIHKHVSTLFPLWEMWDSDDYNMAETISEEIPISVFGLMEDDIVDMIGDHPWHDLEGYLYAYDELDDPEGAGEELDSVFDIRQPMPIWKIFLKLEALLVNDDERLRTNKAQWRNMARRLRFITHNTDHEFLDRDAEMQGRSGSIPWSQDWIDALTAQWAEAKPYLDSTFVFVHWVKESQENLDQAIDVVRLVCEAVAADEQLASASLEDVHDGISSGNAFTDLLAMQQLLVELEKKENAEADNKAEIG